MAQTETNATTPAIWFPTIRTGSGTDIFTDQLVKGLRAKGIRAQITWLPNRAEYAPWSVRIPTPPDWANIVHINTWLPPRFVPDHLPIVATLHFCVHDESLTPYKSRSQKLYHRHWVLRTEATILKRANLVVAVSHDTAKRAQRVFRCSNIKVIHNGIDTKRLFRFFDRSAPHTPFRLLYVGNWSYRKGSDLLAPIMERLGSGFELYYTSDRKGGHKHFAIPANSQCLGRITDPYRLATIYQEADALIFPSRHEGFGLVAIEAQACGLPVIATRCSALPEVVEDHVTGLLCPENHVQAFVDAIRRLARSPTLWRKMRQAARQRAENLFDLSLMVKYYIEIYQSITSK